MGRGEYVSMEIEHKIRLKLDVDFSDVISIVKNIHEDD